MNSELRDKVIETLTDVYDRQAQICESADKIIDLVEAALTQQQEAEPYGYLRENDGAVQISIGSERPADRSGGYATPWAAIYSRPPRPAAQPQVPEPCEACHGSGKLVLHGKHGAVAHEYDCSLCAAKEES